MEKTLSGLKDKTSDYMTKSSLLFTHHQLESSTIQFLRNPFVALWLRLTHCFWKMIIWFSSWMRARVCAIVVLIFLVMSDSIADFTWPWWNIRQVETWKGDGHGLCQPKKVFISHSSLFFFFYYFSSPPFKSWMDGAPLALVIIHKEFIHLLSVIWVRLNCFKSLMKPEKCAPYVERGCWSYTRTFT